MNKSTIPLDIQTNESTAKGIMVVQGPEPDYQCACIKLGVAHLLHTSIDLTIVRAEGIIAAVEEGLREIAAKAGQEIGSRAQKEKAHAKTDSRLPWRPLATGIR